ncbi:hypothetical protein HDU97_002678 [Phlyctochytrium planicorne]|nr:hypothetical protein HDU97_002678 [Phlyctochytrium planicorne]
MINTAPADTRSFTGASPTTPTFSKPRLRAHDLQASAHGIHEFLQILDDALVSNGNKPLRKQPLTPLSMGHSASFSPTMSMTRSCSPSLSLSSGSSAPATPTMLLHLTGVWLKTGMDPEMRPNLFVVVMDVGAGATVRHLRGKVAKKIGVPDVSVRLFRVSEGVGVKGISVFDSRLLPARLLEEVKGRRVAGGGGGVLGEDGEVIVSEEDVGRLFSCMALEACLDNPVTRFFGVSDLAQNACLGTIELLVTVDEALRSAWRRNSGDSNDSVSEGSTPPPSARPPSSSPVSMRSDRTGLSRLSDLTLPSSLVSSSGGTLTNRSLRSLSGDDVGEGPSSTAEEIVPVRDLSEAPEVALALEGGNRYSTLTPAVSTTPAPPSMVRSRSVSSLRSPISPQGMQRWRFRFGRPQAASNIDTIQEEQPAEPVVKKPEFSGRRVLEKRSLESLKVHKIPENTFFPMPTRSAAISVKPILKTSSSFSNLAASYHANVNAGDHIQPALRISASSTNLSSSYKNISAGPSTPLPPFPRRGSLMTLSAVFLPRNPPPFPFNLPTTPTTPMPVLMQHIAKKIGLPHHLLHHLHVFVAGGFDRMNSRVRAEVVIQGGGCWVSESGGLSANGILPKGSFMALIPPGIAFDEGITTGAVFGDSVIDTEEVRMIVVVNVEFARVDEAQLGAGEPKSPFLESMLRNRGDNAQVSTSEGRGASNLQKGIRKIRSVTFRNAGATQIKKEEYNVPLFPSKEGIGVDVGAGGRA